MTKNWPDFPDRYLSDDLACLSSAQAALALPRVPEAYRRNTTARYARLLLENGRR